MNCIIVVDAWKHCEEDDLKQYPWLEKETKLFGSFLDLQLKELLFTDLYTDILGSIKMKNDTPVVIA